MRWRTPVLCVGLVATACNRVPPPASVPVAPPAPMLAPSFVTLAAAPRGTRFHFRVTAPKDRPLFLENCNGAFAWGLEHAEPRGRRPAWIAMINGCHSPPIEIGAGTQREFAEVLSTPPGEALPPGRYRLAVYGLYLTHGAAAHADNLEVPRALRRSMPFAWPGVGAGPGDAHGD